MKADSTCTLAPYFEIRNGQVDAFKTLASGLLSKTRSEAGCVESAFSLSGNIAHCRKGYVDADALLTQLQNVEELLAEAGRISTIIRLEVHAPELELLKLQGPMGELNPQFFSLDQEFTVPARKRGDLRLLSPLTQQELQVIRQMDSGATNREISQCLLVTENTIKFHLKNIFGKLYVNNRLQALIAARDLGLVDA